MEKKNISHLVSPIQDSGNRIQGFEIFGKKPTLHISMFMPCKRIKENTEKYEDCLAQLQELLQKYGDTHYTIMGGDFNADISTKKSSR